MKIFFALFEQSVKSTKDIAANAVQINKTKRIIQSKLKPTVEQLPKIDKQKKIVPINPVLVSRTNIGNIGKLLFGKYLLATNIISSGFLMVAGDLIAQELKYNRGGRIGKRYDWNRVCVMFLVGSLQGPLHHYFYGWMDRAIKSVNLLNVSKKIFLDQTVMSPICIMAFFYPAGYLVGQNFNECTKEVKDKFATVYTTDWIVWPATQFINFYYLHPKYRVVYVNFITMLYNIFLSYMKYEVKTEFETKAIQ